MSGLEFLFHPRSIAVVGVPSNPENMQGGTFFMDALMKFGYRGNLYPVNPRASEILGLKAYPDLMSVPKPLDYVICCLPASLTPQLVKDCTAKGVRAVCIYTAGFSEESAEGRRLEQKLVSLARQGGVRIIGPNCLGIYSPSTHLSYSPLYSKEAGRVGLLCQSGGISSELAQLASHRGIRFSKVISYGNAADLDEADFIEYLAQDVETTTIAAYVEGTKDGTRFLRTLAKAAAVKPVIILKGGRTDGGAKAAASHTGALAGSREKWDILFQQLGVMQVHSLKELLDLVLAFQYIKPPRGKRVGIIGGGGGASVVATDACENAGLSVPAFSNELRHDLERLISKTGNITSNPIDCFAAVGNRSLLLQIAKLVADSKEVDLLIMQVSIIGVYPVESKSLVEWLEAIIEASRLVNLPMAVVPSNGDLPASSGLYFKLHQRCLQAGLAVYPNLSDAAQAIGRFVHYHAWMYDKRASSRPKRLSS